MGRQERATRGSSPLALAGRAHSLRRALPACGLPCLRLEWRPGPASTDLHPEPWFACSGTIGRPAARASVVGKVGRGGAPSWHAGLVGQEAALAIWHECSPAVHMQLCSPLTHLALGLDQHHVPASREEEVACCVVSKPAPMTIRLGQTLWANTGPASVQPASTTATDATPSSKFWVN